MGAARLARCVELVAILLTTVMLLNACARHQIIVFPEQDQSPAQLAQDQAECMAAAEKSTGYSDVARKGLSTTLGGSIVGAIGGAGLGTLLGLWIAANAASDDAGTAGLIVGGGAVVGAVAGWFVGTGLGVRASARHAQDQIGEAFQRCMEKRGYKTGHERA